MNEFSIYIGGVDYTPYVVYPLNFQFVLDTALDQGYIEARNMNKTEAFEPFTLVVYRNKNGSDQKLWYISIDNVIINQKTGKATHKILLVEETKILERIICRAKTFVKPLYRDYIISTTKSVAQPPSLYDLYEWYSLNEAKIKENYTFLVKNVPSQTTDYTAGQTDIPTGYFGFIKSQNTYAKGSTVNYLNTAYFDLETIKKDYGTQPVLAVAFELWDQDYSKILNGKYIKIPIDSSGNVFYPPGFNKDAYLNINLDTAGSFILRVTLKIAVDPQSTNVRDDLWLVGEWHIGVLEKNIFLEKNLYITDTVNKLLQIAEPIRVNESPRFTFNANDAKKYETTPCAEFNFANGATLWENLLEIARTVQCIPRLKNKTLYFEKMGSNAIHETRRLLGKPISNTADMGSEKFASHLDSIVEGLMNLDDEEQGSISEPFMNGFKTLRSETSFTDVRTTVDTAVIKTAKPIEKTTRVTVVYNNIEWDITPYIYEKKEYDLLYTNRGSYPYAKAYALYYVQGQPNIYGLTYKEDDPVSAIFKNWSIENILSTVTNNEVSLGGGGWNSVTGVFSKNETPAKLLGLAFNVTYVSAVNGRARQAKRNVEDLQINSVMAFNQSANRLSSVNFGKRLKGEVALLGSSEKKLVYKCKSFGQVDDIVGNVFGDESYGTNLFISNVMVKMWRDYCIVELGLTKNFNQLGKFVGINSAVRQFEIDTNVSESYLVDEEYLVFSEAPGNYDASAYINGSQIAHSVQAVLVGAATDKNQKVSLAYSYTLAEDYSGIMATYHPVQSVALGNSLLFNYRYDDNYSAGEYLQTLNGKAYKLTRLARYGDAIYGEATLLRFAFFNNVWFPGVGATALGDSLPLVTYHDHLQANTVIENVHRELIVHKSSRDALNITYQIHFVTDCGIIFGDQLLQGNPLVGGTPATVPKYQGGPHPVINFYRSRVNEMTGETDSTPIATAGLNYTVFETFGRLTLYGSAPDNYSSWNVKDDKGRVLIAKNGPFNGLYYYTKRKIGG